jgi:selenocysteine lyase/cysteine desulfurase
MNKRAFLKKIGLLGLLPLLPFKTFASAMKKENPEISFDADSWESIRADYKLKPDYVNLEGGYYCMLPQTILKKYQNNIERINYEHSFFMRKMMETEKEKVLKGLAEFLDCNAEELIITRNTTESLDTVMSGIDWKKGDEVIYAVQEYGSMIEMLKQLSDRYGIVLREISIPLDPKDDEEILNLYKKQLNRKTKLILVSHMINITGQILPVKELCTIAHLHNVEVLVDGAHCIGHFEFKISDLGCDYYGSSLHKWLSVPLGIGLLYVNKNKINKIWPLLGDAAIKKDDIRKLNHTGTIPFAANLTILDAIDFINKIGTRRKEERLRELKAYWVEKLKKLNNPRIQLNSPSDPKRSCAIANVGIEGLKPADLADKLLNDYKIWTVAIDSANVHGIRVTPNVYTTFEELDQFVNAIKDLAEKS